MDIQKQKRYIEEAFDHLGGAGGSDWKPNHYLTKLVGEDGRISFPFTLTLGMSDGYVHTQMFRAEKKLKALTDSLRMFLCELEVYVRVQILYTRKIGFIVKQSGETTKELFDADGMSNKKRINSLGKHISFLIRNSNSEDKDRLIAGAEPLFEKMYDVLYELEQAVSVRETLPGRIYVSSRPSDILTCSDNDYSWSSCWSLDYGERACAPVHFANDNLGLVVYFVADKDTEERAFEPLDIVSHNKRWRTLLFADEGGLYLDREEFPVKAVNKTEMVQGLVNLFNKQGVKMMFDNSAYECLPLHKNAQGMFRTDLGYIVEFNDYTECSEGHDLSLDSFGCYHCDNPHLLFCEDCGGEFNTEEFYDDFADIAEKHIQRGHSIPEEYKDFDELVEAACDMDRDKCAGCRSYHILIQP